MFLLLVISINNTPPLQGEYEINTSVRARRLRAPWPCSSPQSQGSPRIPASLRMHLLQLLLQGAEERNHWKGGGNPPPPASPPKGGQGKWQSLREGARPETAEEGFRSQERQHLGGEEAQGLANSLCPRWESSPRPPRARHRCGACMSQPLSPHRYLTPTLLLLYAFLLLDEKKFFSD